MFKLVIIAMLLIILSFGLKKHSLTILLNLELLCLMIIIISLIIGLEIFNALLMICVGACEGAVSLGSLIRVSRIKNNHTTL